MPSDLVAGMKISVLSVLSLSLPVAFSLQADLLLYDEGSGWRDYRLPIRVGSSELRSSWLPGAVW